LLYTLLLQFYNFYLRYIYLIKSLYKIPIKKSDFTERIKEVCLFTGLIPRLLTAYSSIGDSSRGAGRPGRVQERRKSL